jgi:hypothetical protein
MVINAERDKTSKSKKRRLEIMSNVINAEWDIKSYETQDQEDSVAYSSDLA